MRIWNLFLAGPLLMARAIGNQDASDLNVYKILDSGFAMKNLESAIQVASAPVDGLAANARTIIEELDAEIGKMIQVVRKSLASFDVPAVVSVNAEKLKIQLDSFRAKLSLLKATTTLGPQDVLQPYLDRIDRESLNVKRILARLEA